MNSNFTSCQKESNELLHEDFTESKSPDIHIECNPNFTQAGVSSNPSHTSTSFICAGLYFKLAPKKGEKNSFAGNT